MGNLRLFSFHGQFLVETNWDAMTFEVEASWDNATAIELFGEGNLMHNFINSHSYKFTVFLNRNFFDKLIYKIIY